VGVGLLFSGFNVVQEKVLYGGRQGSCCEWWHIGSGWCSRAVGHTLHFRSSGWVWLWCSPGPKWVREWVLLGREREGCGHVSDTDHLPVALVTHMPQSFASLPPLSLPPLLTRGK
jgi:hypothetical protein